MQVSCCTDAGGVSLCGGRAHKVAEGRGELCASPAFDALYNGLNGSLSSFAALEPKLTAAGFRVLLFDLYGFGLSAAPRGRLDHCTYAEQLAALLDALQVKSPEQILLLGYSMGGVVAVEFAQRYPDRTGRILLVSPGGFLEKTETPCAPLLFQGLRGRCGCCLLHFASCITCFFGWAIRRKVLKPGNFSLDVREPERFAEVSCQNSKRFAWNVRRSVNSYLRVLRRMPLWSDDFRDSYAGLANGYIPVLFIWGTSDCIVPWSEAEEEVVRLFGPRGDSCIRLQGAGHGLLVEDAEQVGGCAVAWFADLKDSAWLTCLAQFRLPATQDPEPMKLGCKV